MRLSQRESKGGLCIRGRRIRRPSSWDPPDTGDLPLILRRPRQRASKDDPGSTGNTVVRALILSLPKDEAQPCRA